jgi:hypothetical protein
MRWMRPSLQKRFFADRPERVRKALRGYTANNILEGLFWDTLLEELVLFIIVTSTDTDLVFG